MIQPKF